MPDTPPTSAATPTWHCEIMRAGVEGLHRNDCWDSEDHQDCRDIVFAVLTGLADAGYRLVKPVTVSTFPAEAFAAEPPQVGLAERIPKRAIIAREAL